MTDPGDTLPGRPTSLPPKRPSARATVVQAIADHPNVWPQLIAGVAFLAASAWLSGGKIPAALQDKLFVAVPFTIGVCVLPTVPTWIATGAKNIGPAIGGLLSSARGSKEPPKDGTP